MSKEKIIFIMGLWVAVLPYLGFPYFLKNILFSITGLGIIFVSYLIYRKSEIGETEQKTFDNFSENRDFIEEEEEIEIKETLGENNFNQ